MSTATRNDSIEDEVYESPSLDKVGSIRDMTQGTWFAKGHDSVQFFGLLGS